MTTNIQAPNHLTTGVLPAEPGYFVRLTNGEESYLVPVVGWAWERAIWRDDDEGDDENYAADPLTGEAVIAGVEGGPYIGTVGYVLDILSLSNEP